MIIAPLKSVSDSECLGALAPSYDDGSNRRARKLSVTRQR